MISKLLNWIVEYFYSHRVITLLGLVAILAGGLYAHNTLETEAYPEFTDPTVRVITLYPGKGAEEVEKRVTVPLEKEMNAIPGESWMRSISILGLSVVSVVFEDGTDQLRNRQQVLERIAQADLPDGVQPGLDPDSGGIGEIYRYTLESKYYSPMDRRTIEDWQLEKAFKQVPGVIEVNSWGGPTKNFQVNIDARKLISYGIPLTQVFQAIQNSNTTAGGNYIENNGSAYVVRGLALLRGVDDIEKVVVGTDPNNTGVPVRIKDIARVDIGPGLRLGQFGKNEDDDALEGIVLMKRGLNASKIVAELKKRLPAIKAGLPEGIKLEKLYDRQELVDNTLDTVGHNVLEGISLVVVVLIVFLFDLTSGLIAAVAIPVALSVALILLKTFHISANLLSLGAIDYGIIVDGAVVMVEYAFAKLSALPHEATREERKALVLQCAQQVAVPILFSIIIIATDFWGVMSLGGVAGKLFRPMAFTMGFHLVGAALSALFIIPTLVGIFLVRRRLSHEESPIIKFGQFIYKPILKFALKAPWLVVGVAVATLLAAGALATQVGSEFLPVLDEGNVWLRATILPTSVSLEEAVKVAHRMREIILTYPEVRNVTSQVGCPDDGTDPNNFSNDEMFLDMKPAAQWRPQFHGNRQELINAMNKDLSAIPNVLLYFSQYIQDNVDEAVAGAKGTLAIKLYGPDIDVLQKLGNQMTDVVKSIPGFVDVANTQQIGQPQYRVEIDRDQCSRYGVNASDIQSLVETAVGGQVATKLIDGEYRFPVRVRFSQEYRNSEQALIDNILIDPPGPMTAIPIAEMCTIKYGSGAGSIARERNQRVMYVRINLRGRDLGSAVREAESRIEKEITMPEGYKYVWAGQYEFLQEATKNLLFIVPITFFLVYILLLGAFGSQKQAVLIMCAVPLSAIGGISALLLSKTYFSISAAVGFIAVSGVAVQNGVILISNINQLRHEEGMSVREAAYHGALNRMRPVLMTATVAMLGLCPAAISTGIGAQTQRPFAIVIIGGLFSATVLTLLVLPALYILFNKDRAMPNSSQSKLASTVVSIIALVMVSLSVTGCSTMPPCSAQTVSIFPQQRTANKLNGQSHAAAASSSSDGKNVVVTLDDAQMKEIKLSTTPVKKGLVSITVLAPGRVGPNAELSRLVSTPSAGRAVEVKSRLGDVVKEGQVMAVIKSDAIGQVQSDLLQNVLQAKADIKQQEVGLKLDRITYERESILFKEQVSAKADLQMAENALEKDEANLAALQAKLAAYIKVAQERLTLLGAPPDSARKVIAQGKIDPWVVIKAPMNGLVIERAINPGEMNDGSKQLFTITDLSQVWLFADVFEKDIHEVNKGDEATVTIDSIPGRTFPAKIIWVGDSVNTTTRTLPLRANVSNNSMLLRPGMFARMKIAAAQLQLLRVPHASVMQRGERSFAFVQISPRTFEQRQVTTGIEDSDGIEIKSGLKQGEQVVVQGSLQLLGTAMKDAEGKD
ncbi:MAG TPA: CusA/CzcA family heavy metal efflux RND transporter [Oculatellaceae cyanobacterium]